jgi:hypothetical protein
MQWQTTPLMSGWYSSAIDRGGFCCREHVLLLASPHAVEERGHWAELCAKQLPNLLLNSLHDVSPYIQKSILQYLSIKGIKDI